MVLSQPYQHQPDAIASYAYTDIANSTGYIVYYGYISETASGVTRHLGTTQEYSSSESVNDGICSELVDNVALDFDLTPFAKPQTLKGTANLICCVGISSTGTSWSGAPIATIIKVSGGVPTTIGTGTMPNINVINTNKIFNIPITISETLFKVGDILRLSIVCDSTATAASAAIGTDPMNRDDNSANAWITPSTDTPTSTTILKLKIPYRIDL